MQTNLYLESVIEVNHDAIDIATGLDKDRAEGNVRGPLHGVSVLVEDVRPLPTRAQDSIYHA